jgi:hypothetical protein
VDTVLINATFFGADPSLRLPRVTAVGPPHPGSTPARSSSAMSACTRSARASAPATLGSTCTSPRPAHPGSTWSSWFAELTNRKLRRSARRSVTELETGIRKWINEWNKDPKPFVWTKSANEILETLAAYCQRIIDLEH